jgi:hypothetical protein
MASQDAARTGMAASSGKKRQGSKRLQRRINDWFKCDEQRGAAPRSYADTKKPSPNRVMVVSGYD